jgi:uncharacterized membrane protein YkoI
MKSKFLLTSLQVQHAKPLWAQVSQGACKKFLSAKMTVVQKGEKLAVLESATIANLVAELIESASAFKVADADYRRKQKIATENILSEKVMLESESARRIAEAKLLRR